MAAGPIRILCVEDHPVYREGLRTIIGCELDMLLVGYAGNSTQAIAEFRRHRPDITLMDLRLPGADGTDVLVTIRGEFPRARVIMLTTSDGDADIQRAMRAGFWLHAKKYAHGAVAGRDPVCPRWTETYPTRGGSSPGRTYG